LQLFQSWPLLRMLPLAQFALYAFALTLNDWMGLKPQVGLDKRAAA